MFTRQIYLPTSRFLLLLSCLAAYSTVHSQTFTVHNGGITRTIATSPSLRTTSLKNNLTGKDFAVDAEEFSIMLDDSLADFSGPVLKSTDFVADGKPVQSTDGKTLRVPLINAQYGVRVTVVYDADGATTMHKWLEITCDKPHNVSTIEVERMDIAGAARSLPSLVVEENTTGDGPVYADNFFLGLEFPKQDNSFDGKFIRLRHFPGKDMKPGETLISKKAILGASPDTPMHRLKDSFLEYVDAWRSPKIRDIKVYNTWFLLVFAQKEDTLLQAIESHVKPLHDRGVRLDGFVVDDGWQDKKTLWQVDSTMLPSGLGPDSKIQKALAKYGAKLHLWLPLTGQYGIGGTRKDSNWYTERGYETGTNWDLCLAPGNKIWRDKKERMLEVIRLGVASIKADFALLGCNKKGHHHLPNAQYGMEANIEGIIDIITAMRAENPELFYYLTTAINKSPWWLGTNDLLWESFWDDIKYYSGNHEATPAQRRMSGRDEYHWQNNMKWFVPQTSFMTHGIIASNDPADELYCSLQEMVDIATLYYARGVMWSEIYVTGMDSAYWDALADVIHWSDAHRSILTKQPAMSGGPSGHKPYFWSHFNNDTGLVIVRNPTGTERGVGIPLTESSRMEKVAGGVYRVEVVKPSPLSNVKEELIGYYHYGDTARLFLDPWQMKVVQVTPVRNAESTLRTNTTEIDLGLIDPGHVYDTTVTISGGSHGVVAALDYGTFFTVGHKRGESSVRVHIETKDLQYASTYTGRLTVWDGSGRTRIGRHVIVRFQTIFDPKAPYLYLSDIDPVAHKQGYGQYGQDRTVDGNPLTIAKTKYEKGIGTHARAETVFDLTGLNVSRFTAMVGQDDETKGTISFSVFRDFGNGFETEPAFSSGVMKQGDPAKAVDLSLNGAVKLKLVVGNANDGISGDHADWADAKIVR